MKKRTVIAIIITIICIIATNKFWLIFKPINVSFNIKGQGTPFIEVCLDKKKAGHKIDLIKKHRFETDVKRAKFPKHLEIVFNDVSALGGGPLTISEIQLRNKNYSPADFVVKNADFKIENNTIIIYPQKENFSIVYNKKLKLRAAIKFEFEILVIITVIAFLIAYKLVDYIADFKTVKKHSRIDIIFLTIFFAMLFIPMAHIDDGIVSTREDRVLAKWKPLFLKDGKINLNFGNDFNKWFNDRFNLRPHLIFLYVQTNFLIKQNYVSLTITDIYKTSDYFFDKKNTAYEHNSQDIEIFSKNINKLHKFCNNNGIKLYVIIVPSKVSFYQKYDLKFKKLLPDKTNELQKNLKEKYNIEIIYPEKEFKKYEDKDFIYFKPDHHMTDFGQYILYSLLINKMQQDFPMLSATPLSDFKIYKSKQIRWNWDRKFHNGQMYHKSMLNYPKLLKDSYTYYDYKYPEKIKIIGEGTHITHINNNGNYKLLIVGDSFSENLVYFLNTNFSHIERYRHNMKTKEIIKKYDLEMKPYEKIMKELKPDALVIIRHSGMLKEFKDMYPKEER